MRSADTAPQTTAATAATGRPELSYAAHTYGVESGMPHNVAATLVQTGDGYLWAGTESGLARFDGNRFVNFRVRNTPGLPHNLIRSLLADDDGSLWIGTPKGLSRWKNGRLELVAPLATAITGMSRDRDGHLRLATLGQSLKKFHDGQLVDVDTQGIIPANVQLRTVFTDSTGRLLDQPAHRQSCLPRPGRLVSPLRGRRPGIPIRRSHHRRTRRHALVRQRNRRALSNPWERNPPLRHGRGIGRRASYQRSHRSKRPCVGTRPSRLRHGKRRR
ncbi:MAG: two-component regulator propeller domain-containing protein [Nibricoccus sp.]